MQRNFLHLNWVASARALIRTQTLSPLYTVGRGTTTTADSQTVLSPLQQPIVELYHTFGETSTLYTTLPFYLLYIHILRWQLYYYYYYESEYIRFFKTTLRMKIITSANHPNSLSSLVLRLVAIGVAASTISSSICGDCFVSAIEVGDKVPMTDDIAFHYGFPPEIMPLSGRLLPNKKVLIVGLPGAFTPT
jgi:hypothetical protein